MSVPTDRADREKLRRRWRNEAITSGGLTGLSFTCQGRDPATHGSCFGNTDPSACLCTCHDEPDLDSPNPSTQWRVRPKSRSFVSVVATNHDSGTSVRYRVRRKLPIAPVEPLVAPTGRSAMSELHTHIDSMSFSPIPLGHPDRWAWAVTVDYVCGPITEAWYAVRNNQDRSLSRAEEWDYEPSNRTTEWLANHRYGLSEAMVRAKTACRSVTRNGVSAQDIADRLVTAPWARPVERTP